jgi:hypothetical protein
MGKHCLPIVLLLLTALSQQGCIGAGVGLMRLATGGHERKGDAPATSYTPTIKLTESVRTIEAHAQLGPFENSIPPANPEMQRGDQEVTKSMMEGDLTDLVQQAVLADFRANSVYSSIRLHDEHHDLTLRGNIYQFSEYRSRLWYAKIPLLGRLFSDNERIEGGVSLDVMVSTPDGLLVGIYSGQSRFPVEASSSQFSPKNQRAPGQQLNRAFTEAMRQIRAKMLADEQLGNGGWRRPAHIQKPD